MKHSLAAFLCTVGLFALTSCSSLTLEGVDFGWPVESVVTVSEHNRINEGHFALSFNVAKIATEEFKDSTALHGKQLRLLRSSEGYYFVTGPRFKNVYVYASSRSELRNESVIHVSEKGLRNPALNQRAPFVELVDGDSFRRLLTRDDIAEGEAR